MSFGLRCLARLCRDRISNIHNEESSRLFPYCRVSPAIHYAMRSLADRPRVSLGYNSVRKHTDSDRAHLGDDVGGGMS